MHASRKLAASALLGTALATPLHAQTTLTYSSWVPPMHHLTVWQANWAAQVEKATGGGVAEAVANAIGASAFVKPAPESYELLNSGVADGVFFPFESIASFKLDTVLQQATVFPGGMYSSAFGFFMNEDKWQKLSKQDQEIINKYSFEYAARSNGQSWDAADQKGIEALKKANVKIVQADPAFTGEVRRLSAPIIDDWIKKAGASG